MVARAEIGPAFLFEDRLAASSAYLMLGAGAEYPLDPSVSLVGDLALGLAGTPQLKLRGGARYRFAGLDLPVAPYVEGQLVVGQLFGVLGSDLSFFGLRAGAGADYFLTGSMLIGMGGGLEFDRTTGDRPVWFEQLEVLVRAAFVF